MIIASKHSGYMADGRRLYPMDGGGGSAPAEQTQTVKQDLPDWAIPYAQEVLGMGKKLGPATYDESGKLVSGTPYQTYGGERQAQFTPMQQQAFQGAAGMGPSAATGEATQRALGMSYDPYATGQFGAQASQYMDPYMQNVVGIQQREAQRQADIAGTQRGAQAVQSGAFGGSRQAIMDAEAARNLATQKGDIQARGLQDAYGRGQTQFNTEQQLREQSKQYGAGLGLQGLQTAIQGAGQQFGQGMDVNKLQQAYGTQQQQQVQAGLTQQYEDFLAQKKAPYQQLEFQSNLLRGTPSGSTSTMYAPTASAGSQVLGAATSLGGAYMLGGRAAGGTVSSYAKGGEVTDVKAKRSKKKSAGLAELALSKMA
jgi:hypothetical protein